MLKIFLLVNVSLLCWTIVNMQSKEILNVDPPSGSISICEICFLRAVIHFLASLVLLKLTEKKIEKVPQDCVPTLILRSVIGTVTFFISIVPVQLIQLSIYQAVLCTIPFWVGILQYFWLKIPVTLTQVLSFLVAYTGIIIINFGRPDAFGKAL